MSDVALLERETLEQDEAYAAGRARWAGRRSA